MTRVSSSADGLPAAGFPAVAFFAMPGKIIPLHGRGNDPQCPRGRTVCMEFKDTSGYSAARELDAMIAVAESAEETLRRAERQLAETHAVLAAGAALRERRKLGAPANARPDVPHASPRRSPPAVPPPPGQRGGSATPAALIPGP